MHAILEAGKQLGYDILDPNGQEQIGKWSLHDIF